MADNETLLILLAHHHGEAIARDLLHPTDERFYGGTKLYFDTKAVIDDPLRMRVPKWPCPTCGEKFPSGEALAAHRKDAHHEAQPLSNPDVSNKLTQNPEEQAK